MRQEKGLAIEVQIYPKEKYITGLEERRSTRHTYENNFQPADDARSILENVIPITCNDGIAFSTRGLRSLLLAVED